MRNFAIDPPANWLQTLENIRMVRRHFVAPVDSMGCAQVAEGGPGGKGSAEARFQVLVSLMLSSQTKDPITWAAVERLRARGLASVETIREAPHKDIEDTIYPVGFYRRKAVYLKQVGQILHDQYSGDVPDTVAGLCSLPGVGPKMAHLCMSEAWNVVSGIGVDTHVHRIAARLGWTGGIKCRDPEETRRALEAWLPRDHWREINHLLVGLGQTICTPTGPKCSQCYNAPICPSAFAKTPKRAKAAPKSPASPSRRSSEPPSDVNHNLGVAAAAAAAEAPSGEPFKSTKRAKIEIERGPRDRAAPSPHRKPTTSSAEAPFSDYTPDIKPDLALLERRVAGAEKPRMDACGQTPAGAGRRKLQPGGEGGRKGAGAERLQDGPGRGAERQPPVAAPAPAGAHRDQVALSAESHRKCACPSPRTVVKPAAPTTTTTATTTSPVARRTRLRGQLAPAGKLDRK